MLRGPVACKLRTVLVSASRSQVTFPSQAGALTKFVAPPSVEISARIPSMADCRVSCSVLRSPAVAKGPAFCRASISVSWPSSRASLRASAASTAACWTKGSRAVAMSWLTSAGAAAVRSLVLAMGSSAVAMAACRLAGRHVQGQLVHDALERVRGCDASQRRVVGRKRWRR